MTNPHMAGQHYTLQVTDLKKHFGGVRALDGVSFSVRSGECVALIGPNGAGKSTCFGTLAGQHQPDAGRVEWGASASAHGVQSGAVHGEQSGAGKGEQSSANNAAEHGAEHAADSARLQDITGHSAAALSARGIGRTFQVAQLFEALTVLQNVQLVAQYPRQLAGFLPLKNQGVEAAHALLQSLGLQAVAHTQALLLPYGLKKRLELGIALAGQPRLLLLDEPAAGLAELERRDLMLLIKSLTAPDKSLAAENKNLAILYTEHNMDAVFGIADRVLVLIDGKLAAQGTPGEVAESAVVRSRYLGTTQNTHLAGLGQKVGAAAGQGAPHA